MNAAEIMGAVWANSLRTCHYDTVYCYETYATDVIEGGTPDYSIFPIPVAQQRGTLASANRGDVLPFWNCVRVDLPVYASRPSRKFIRPTLRELDVTANQTLAGPVEDAIRTALAFLTSDLRFRDESDNAFQAIGRVSITSRRLGRQAAFNVPDEPPLG